MRGLERPPAPPASRPRVCLSRTRPAPPLHLSGRFKAEAPHSRPPLPAVRAANPPAPPPANVMRPEDAEARAPGRAARPSPCGPGRGRKWGQLHASHGKVHGEAGVTASTPHPDPAAARTAQVPFAGYRGAPSKHPARKAPRSGSAPRRTVSTFLPVSRASVSLACLLQLTPTNDPASGCLASDTPAHPYRTGHTSEPDPQRARAHTHTQCPV